MSEAHNPLAQRSAAEQFVSENLDELCREMVSLDETGLFGTGKLSDLRNLCSFAGASAQSLAKGMVESAAIRSAASQAPVTLNELLRGMDAWGASAFHADDRAVEFLNYFLAERNNPTNQWK